MITIILITVAICAIAFYYLFGSRNKNAIPPGPRRLPLVGNLHQIGNKPEVNLSKWAREFGKFYSLDFVLLRPVIVLNDPKIVKECCNEIAFTGRPVGEVFKYLTRGHYGIGDVDGPAWEEQRRFTLRQLRDFGFGKKSMETLIMDEVTEMLDIFRSNVNKPLEIKQQFELAVVNALWCIVSGQRHSQRDAKLKAFLDQYYQTFAILQKKFWMPLLPKWFIETFPGITGLTQFKKSLVTLHAMIDDTIEDHEKSHIPGEPRDFTDAYLDEIGNTKDPNSSFYKETGKSNMFATLLELFNAGTATTSSTLQWMMCYLIKNEDVQEKVREEIFRVVGHSRLPSTEDRPLMPYTEATVMELMRIVSLVPQGGARMALSPKRFLGYDLPKSTFFIPNVEFIHMNPEIWGDPQNFRPERFLSEDKQSVVRHEAWIPFSVGRRICIGERLATDSVFLFTTSIVQNFKLKEDPSKPIDFDWYYSLFIKRLSPYRLILEEIH